VSFSPMAAIPAGRRWTLGFLVVGDDIDGFAFADADRVIALAGQQRHDQNADGRQKGEHEHKLNGSLAAREYASERRRGGASANRRAGK